MTKIDWKQWMNQLDSLPQDARLVRTSMTEDDHQLEAIWNCAFPTGLSHNEVLQLIHLMYVVDGETHPMSMRAVANHIGVLLGVNYIYPLNEVYGVNDIESDRTIQLRLKERMKNCGYYDWLANDGYPTIEANTIEQLLPIISRSRPCTRLTLHRQPLKASIGISDFVMINTFLRSLLSLPETWPGIEWREFPTSTLLWEEMIRAIQYNSDRSEQYVNPKEAHVLVSTIVKMLTDFERTARSFTNHRANGIWYSVTESRWQYWLVTINMSDIGVFGVEEA